jgi:hypothetical protein
MTEKVVVLIKLPCVFLVAAILSIHFFIEKVIEGATPSRRRRK